MIPQGPWTTEKLGPSLLPAAIGLGCSCLASPGPRRLAEAEAGEVSGSREQVPPGASGRLLGTVAGQGRGDAPVDEGPSSATIARPSPSVLLQPSPQPTIGLVQGSLGLAYARDRRRRTSAGEPGEPSWLNLSGKRPIWQETSSAVSHNHRP
jgi:hypothetical protein